MSKDILKKIPGFRTGRKWKMVLAVIMYLVIILAIISPSGATFRDKLVSIMESLIMIGIPFVLITNLGNIRSKLPIFNKKTTKSTILGVFITFVIMGMSLSMVDNFKSSEQKQLDLLSAQQGEEQAEAKAESKKVALALNDKIVALGAVDSLSYDSAEDVILIRDEYEALTSEQKSLVTKISLLESAEKKLIDIKTELAKAIDVKIAALGDINTLIYDNVDTVMLIRKEYDTLTSEQKENVTKLALLESAEKKTKDIMTEVALALDVKILALGDVNTLAFDKAEAVLSIRREYEALSIDEKNIVTNIVILESAEKRITDLQVIADKIAAEKEAEERAVAEKKEAEEKAVEEYEKWISSQFSIWDGSNIYLVKLLKENLNDPKSFEHVETVYWDKGTYILVKMSYRAKNAFGGLILQNVTAKADYESQTISIISQND